MLEARKRITISMQIIEDRFIKMKMRVILQLFQHKGTIKSINLHPNWIIFPFDHQRNMRTLKTAASKGSQQSVYIRIPSRIQFQL